MKRYYATIMFVLAVISGQAQSIRVPAGKKFTATTSSTSNTTVTVMGQSIENTTDLSSIQEYTIQSVRPTGYTLVLIPKKFSGKVSVMGQEQKFDSDDSTTNPMDHSKSFVNKPQEIVVDNGKATTTGEVNAVLSAMGMNTNNAYSLFFLTTTIGLKPGASWTDSTNAESFKISNQYFVTAITADQVELRVTSDIKMNTTLKQGGMDVQTDMKGLSTSTRIYNKTSGLLISDKTASEITGVADAMGMKAPMTMKTTSQITVQ